MLGLTECVATFGEALRTIREVIGLTQRQLADAAGLSDALIRKAEAAEALNIKRSTAIEIYRALKDRAARSRRPVPDQLWRDFETLANLPAAVLSPQSAGELGQLQREASARLGMAADVQKCHDLVDDLIQARGPAAVLKLLEAASTFSVEATVPPEPSTLRVVSPPVQKPGYVEQVIAEYEHRSGESEAQAAGAKP